jgi:DNA-binding transcriptional regulator YdaS (Cro superfamily)
MNLKLKIAILEKFPIQADFAKRIGISETVLSRIIKERRDAPPELREIIANELGAKVGEIFPRQ